MIKRDPAMLSSGVGSLVGKTDEALGPTGESSAWDTHPEKRALGRHGNVILGGGSSCANLSVVELRDVFPGSKVPDFLDLLHFHVEAAAESPIRLIRAPNGSDVVVCHLGVAV